MSWQTQADRALQIMMTALSTAVTYAPSVGAPYALKGIYSSPAREVDPMSGAVVSSTHPTLGVRLADLLAPPTIGDQATIGASVYRVIDCEEDGEGGATLTLQRTG